MAPEIHLRQSYSYKADLWSVGVILYRMLTGRKLFSSLPTTTQLQDPTFSLFQPRLVKKRVSEDCLQLLSGLLQINPQLRFTWEEFYFSSWLDMSASTKNQSQDNFASINDLNLWDTYSPSEITPSRLPPEAPKSSSNSSSSSSSSSNPRLDAFDQAADAALLAATSAKKWVEKFARESLSLSFSGNSGSSTEITASDVYRRVDTFMTVQSFGHSLCRIGSVNEGSY